MRLDSDFADAEFAAHLLVQQPGGHQGHHLPLARGEGSVTIPDFFRLRRIAESHAAALERLPDSGQKRIITEWLCEELDCTRLHRLHRHRHITVSGDEDDW